MKDPGEQHDTNITAADASAEPAAAVRLRQVADDRYQLGRELARGGMGVIYQARDVDLDRPVAIKELLPGDAEMDARFRREALLTARLQHPGIVPVYEAGTWPSGEPFYAMKLVSGRSLAAVISEARTLAERLALVPKLLAVTEAIAYAHSEKIIHRDLKPANVIIGRFGETVVIDWGLAKDLRAGAPEPLGARVLRSAVQGDDALTLAGDVLGTPAYMSPEQAKGRAVDERTDVFALGVMLYHLLAGRHPYNASKASTDDEGRIQLPEPVPLIARQPGAPPELLALVAKAMAPDPEARYPSAVELAEDLRRFTSGQMVGAHRYTTWHLVQRWAGRHRVALAAAAAAVVAVAAVGAVSISRIVAARHAAEAARASAELQRGAADKLVFTFLEHQRRQLAQLGRLDLLKGVTEDVEAYYSAAGGDDDDALGRRAKALEALGDLHLEEGSLDKALAAYQKCLAAATARAAHAPDDGDRQLAVASAEGQIGDVALARNELPAALASYTRAMAIMEKLAARPKASPMWRRGLGVASNKVGTLERRLGHLDASLAAYRRGLDVIGALAQELPDQLQLVADLGEGNDYVGQVQQAQGDLDGALASYQAAAAAWRRALERAKGHVMVRFGVASADADVAEVQALRGDLDAALAAYDRLDLELADLLGKEPNNSDWRRLQGDLLRRRGDALVARKDAAGAAKAYDAAAAVFDALLAKDPGNADWKSDRARVTAARGRLAP